MNPSCQSPPQPAGDLVVPIDGSDEHDVKRCSVVAVKCRFSVMQVLIRVDVFDANRPAPCMVRTDNAGSGEVSCAGNIVRVARCTGQIRQSPTPG